jgi:hypothetical protein
MEHLVGLVEVDRQERLADATRERLALEARARRSRSFAYGRLLSTLRLAMPRLRVLAPAQSSAASR